MTPVIDDTAHWQIRLNYNQNLLGKLLIVLKHQEEQVAISPSRSGKNYMCTYNAPPSGCKGPSHLTTSTTHSCRTRIAMYTCV